MRQGTVAQDLFDLEARPGAGSKFWADICERQVEKVVECSNRFRQAQYPDEGQRIPDATAETDLHAHTYFLTLAIRRVLLFHDALAKKVNDERLTAARAAFDAVAPHAKDIRDAYEHLDEYALGHGKKLPGQRHAPVLGVRWDMANVQVWFGPLEMDVTKAGQAAVKLGRETYEVYLDAHKAARPKLEKPPKDDGVHRQMVVRFGVSTICAWPDQETRTGVLQDVEVRPSTPEEIARDDMSGVPR